MSLLVKSAAVATIVAAVFTVATYFDNDNDVLIGIFPSPAIESDDWQPPVNPHYPESDIAIEEKVDPNKREMSPTEVIRAKHQAALRIPSTVSRSSALKQLSEKTADLGYFKESYEIGLDIPSTVSQSSALKYLSVKVANSGDIEFAIEIANKIPSSVSKSNALKEISGI
ncbi:hypothetical protein [Teredinibacter sp. KSP-S5-2]|uniref:hypothetical protein n=1 Tax=Teredinibacter sp. KSP-S5-2 TaxID=3034506 RepID=UPI002934C3AC|nr:hypothetical protein [Teredinibacter sp. KSP-S5-2]WNO10083.1 hypothetical protein P5V12_02750 [Teredinibacter sp. KSP-S5-2]